MTTLTDSDIKEIKDLMIALRQDIQKLEIGQAEIKAKVEGLEKRVDDINSRLNIMTIGFLSEAQEEYAKGETLTMDQVFY